MKKRRVDYRGVSRVCEHCGVEYTDVKNRRVRFCSAHCFGLYSKRDFVCGFCGAVYITTSTRNTKYCCRACWIKSLAGRVVPNWVGEKITVTKLAGREPTDSRRIRKLAKFVKVRKKMLLRDGFTCQICFGSGMDAHHIVTIREQPELAYELSNLVTVCKSCHDKKVSKREKEWEAYFKKVVGL